MCLIRVIYTKSFLNVFNLLSSTDMRYKISDYMIWRTVHVHYSTLLLEETNRAIPACFLLTAEDCIDLFEVFWHEIFY